MRLLLPALLVTIAGSCSGSSTEPAHPVGADVTAKMNDHFAAITKLHKAITHGDLAAAKRHAGEFTTHLRNADHPDSWRPYLQDVRSALFGIASAETVERAAVGTARAGRACGACHAALGIEAMPAGSVPPIEKPEDLSEYMWQHMWASESMWNGLVGPSAEAWKEGAESLARAGPFPESKELTPKMRELASQLNTLGQQAIATQGIEDQAVLYGSFLSACAGCHQQFVEVVD